MSNFKDRLIRAMSLRGMTQADLVKASGLSKPRINQYVNGVYEAKQDALLKLATALDINVAWLMGHDVPMEVNYEEIKKEIEICEMIQQTYGEDAIKLFSIYLSLNTEGKQAALAMLQGLTTNQNYKKD